ncbi:TPA: phage tail protein, partial [Streptococcus suis]|nr:phage tail protein [Streptococcus suis]
MLLTIHDANLKKVAFIDNDKQETLNYYDDTWTRSLETGSSTFEFTVYKKAIKSDTAINKIYNLLNERAFVSFRHNGKSYVFNVMTVEENEQTIKCYCENLNLELINEYANPYKATKAMSFVEYCNAMDLLNFTHLSVGINEISDQKRTLEWDGQDTKLARLLSLAKKFDAEIDFDTYLNADSSIKAFKVNVYHENDDNHQGVGRVRNDIQLTYGKNLKSIKRKIDKTGVYNAIRPTGKRIVKNGKGEEVEEIVTIGSLGEWSENNKDGVREFYQQGDMLYAPLSMQMYPSTFTSSTTNDQWIRKDMEVESDSPSVIRAAAIANLRKNAYPALTYEVDGFIDVEIGDTIRIYDDGFTPILLVQARVSHQKISFTNPASNQTTFANFKALENNLSDGIQAAFERLFEASKPYLIKLSTDNGVIFKNQIGQSIVTPTLYKGGKPVVANVTWRWALDGNTSTGMTYTVLGSNVTDTATLTVAAYIGNDEVAVDEISFVNVLDGTMGTPGKPGQDGRTPYVHTAWSDNETGTSGFSLDSSINKLYIGIYTDFEPMDSQDPRKYKWTKIKGDKGDKGDTGARGIQGIQGVRGEQGIPGEKGADGRTQYTHIAYADNATGGGFSQTDQTKAYIGMYQDFNVTDSTNPSSYRWSPWKGKDGKDGVPGPKGADGRTPYIHWAYSDNADGTGLTTSDNGQRYIGHYSDYTQADSTDKTKYRWADRWAKIEVGGRNILRNATFSNPKERSETFTVGGTTYKNIEIPSWFSMYNSGISNPTTSYHAFYRESFNGTGPVIEFNESNGRRNWKALAQALQASDLRVGKYTFSAD